MSKEIDAGNVFIHDVDIAKRYRFGLIRAYEPIPRGAIADVVINENMAERVTDPHLKKWLNPDYLIQKAAIFGLGNEEGTHFRVQTPSSNRSVYLQKDALFFDEFGNAYGSISAKGTGTHINFSMSSDPAGMFGTIHAEAEKEVSEYLANSGARVGRVLGHIILDPDNFLNWLKICDKNPNYFPVSDLSKITNAKDTPAIVVRLEGSERVADLNNNGYYSQTRTYGRAARLHLREIHGRGGLSSYLEHYQIPQSPDFIDHLKWLAYLGERGNDLEDYRLSFEEIRHVAFLYYYFHELNLLSAKKVSERYYNGKLTIKNAAQDADVAGFWYDFETSTPDRIQYYKEGLVANEKVNCPDMWPKYNDPRLMDIKKRAKNLANNNSIEVSV